MATKKPSTPAHSTLYQDIRSVIDSARNKVYQTANFAMVQAYWSVGRLIVEEEQQGQQRAAYGASLIKTLSKELVLEFGKGFDESNLRHMRNFYSNFQKQDALRPELSWTHYRLLLKINNEQARNYYMSSSAEQRWSTRELERQIHTQYYERILATNPKEILPIPVSKKGIEKLQPKDVIKDPYVLEFLDIKGQPDFKETDLELALVDQLQSFLLELGKGFSFVGRQYRLSADTKHYYIDLVFYNYLLKCFVLIDLKTGSLSHEDIGQMDFYVRYFEDQIKQADDNPTIGLILCAEKDNTIAKYSLLSESKQIFASKYKTYLPTEEELQREIDRSKHQLLLERKLSK